LYLKKFVFDSSSFDTNDEKINLKLAVSISEMKSLKKLELKCDKINDLVLEGFSNSIRRLYSLTELGIITRFSRISDVGIGAFSQALSRIKNLHRITLNFDSRKNRHWYEETIRTTLKNGIPQTYFY
jgi:hypothetical protein